jgi:putative nucleotidyltransferase with HDIG domain
MADDTSAGATAAPPDLEARLADQMEKVIIKKIAADQLVVPSLPAAALKCMQLIRNPDFSLQDAVAVIERDPILTAQIIKMANSAALASREPVRNVLQALGRIGVKRLGAFLVEACARTVFESRDPRILAASRGLWDHSLAVAMLAKKIVSLSKAGDADTAYLGGLLHDVGKPIVAALLLEVEKASLGRAASAAWIQSSQWIGVVHRVHRKVGVALAEKWQLSESTCQCIKDCGSYDKANPASVTNAVTLANALAKREGLSVGPPGGEDSSSLVADGAALLGLDDAAIASLTSGLKQSVEQQR